MEIEWVRGGKSYSIRDRHKRGGGDEEREPGLIRHFVALNSLLLHPPLSSHHCLLGPVLPLPPSPPHLRSVFSH